VDPIEQRALNRRTRRAFAVIAASLAAIVVASLIYLHPKIEGPPPPTIAAAPAPTPKLLFETYWADFTFVTPTLGWSLVESRTTWQYWIFRTTDAAKTWELQTSGDAVDPAKPFRSFDRRNSIHFFDRTHGLVITGASGAYRTTDAGRHWTKLNLPPYNIDSLTFSDPNHAWLIGWTQTYPSDPVYHYEYTADGGTKWTALPSPALAKGGYGFVFTGLKFRSPTEGWASGTDVDQPAVFSSKDGGILWSQSTIAVPRESAQGKFSATNDITLLPGGGVLAAFRDSAFTSFDDGHTWRPLRPPPGTTSYRDFVFQDATHWWAMQYDSNLYKTSDAGQTWKRVSYQLDALVYTIGVVDAQNAWARLDSQIPTRHGYGLALTRDGGIHWTYANVPTLP
jgi:photosystem II stability/assembly factor-like uncharacterized protein